MPAMFERGLAREQGGTTTRADDTLSSDPRIVVTGHVDDVLVLRATCASVVERLPSGRSLLIVPLEPLRLEVRSASATTASRPLRPHSLCYVEKTAGCEIATDRAAAALVVALPPGRLASLHPAVGSSGTACLPSPVLGLDHPDLPMLAAAIVRLLSTRSPTEVFLSCAVEWFASRCAVELAHAGDGVDAAAGRALEAEELRATLERIERVIPDPVPVNELADALGMSSSRFSRAFKRATGSPPSRYILARRVERACELLESGGQSLVDITFACGFSSQSHMTSVFVRERGVTPGRYRDALHERRAGGADRRAGPKASEPAASKQARSVVPRLASRHGVAVPGKHPALGAEGI